MIFWRAFLLALTFLTSGINAATFNTIYKPSLVSVKISKIPPLTYEQENNSNKTKTREKSAPQYGISIRIEFENISANVLTGKESFTAYVTDLSTNNQTTLVGSVEFGLSPGDSIGCTLDSYQYLDYKPNAIKVLLIRQYPSQNPDGSFSWIPDPVWTSFQMKRQGNEYLTVEGSGN